MRVRIRAAARRCGHRGDPDDVQTSALEGALGLADRRARRQHVVADDQARPSLPEPGPAYDGLARPHRAREVGGPGGGVETGLVGDAAPLSEQPAYLDVVPRPGEVSRRPRGDRVGGVVAARPDGRRARGHDPTHTILSLIHI